MLESVQGLADWLAALPATGIYAVLFAVSYLENVVPPIPGDTLIVLCGWLVGQGVIAFVPTVALASLGGALGFMTMYAVGRALGDAVDDPGRLRWIPRGPVATVRRWLARWGQGVVVLNRFLAGGRSVIALLAGASRMPAGQTALWSTVSAVGWCTALVGGGAWVGGEWERVLDVLAVYGQVVSGLVALVLVGVAVRWGWRRRAEAAERRKETAKSNPTAGDEGSAR